MTVFACDKCGAENPPAMEVIVEHGYGWHRPCVRWFGGGVDFPSDGQLIPSTIMSED